MPRFFISYRRDDSAYPAHAIYDRLAAHFGPGSAIFDVDTIPLGVDFVEYLDEQVRQCDVLLAVICDSWTTSQGRDGKRRLDDPKDFVRIEIAAALKREEPLPIPDFRTVGDTPIDRPSSNLIDTLQAMQRRQAAGVDRRLWPLWRLSGDCRCYPLRVRFLVGNQTVRIRSSSGAVHGQPERLETCGGRKSRIVPHDGFRRGAVILVKKISGKIRTRQHVIADLAVNHLERQVLLLGYTAQRTQQDYGYAERAVSRHPDPV